MIHISAMNRVESAEYIQSSMDGFYRVNGIVLKHEHCIDLQRQMSQGNWNFRFFYKLCQSGGSECRENKDSFL